MIVCKYIEKIWDKNKITGYVLEDAKENTVTVGTEQLKELIRKKELDVVNLHLTTNNRLMDRFRKYKDSLASMSLAYVTVLSHVKSCSSWCPNGALLEPEKM